MKKLAPILLAGALFGASWTPINTGLPAAAFGITGLTVAPSAPSTVYARTNVATIYKSIDGAGSWNEVSGVNGALFLIVDPANSSTLYAATERGVVKSIDGGASWSAANAGLSDICLSLAIDPVTSSTLYCLNFAQVFRSTDGAQSWQKLYDFATGVGPLAIDPANPSTMYVATIGATIFKSTDAGKSWTSIKSGLSESVFANGAIPLAIDPQNSDTLYAGSFANSALPFDFGAGSISKSADGGRTWTVLRAGIPSDAFVRSLAIDPASPSTIYAGYSGQTKSGILNSVDGGQTWTVVNSAASHDGIVALGPSSPSAVYAGYSDLTAGGGGVFKSVDGGASWNSANAGLSYIDLRVMAIDSSKAGRVYTGGAGGAFRSDDSGMTWTALSPFPPATQSPFNVGAAIARSLLINSTNPDVLYVEVTRAGGCVYSDQVVFKSADGGASWDGRVSPPDSGCDLGGYIAYTTLMAMNPADPNTLYLGETEDEDGIYDLLKSSDGGANWNSFWNYTNGLNSGLNALAIDPIDATTLYAGVGDAFAASESAAIGLFKSVDGGATWNITGLNGAAVTVIAIDPANPVVLYASTQGVYKQPLGFRGLYKSTDGGQSWNELSSGLENVASAGATITALAIAPGDSNVLYAATSGDGVYQSADGGASWVKSNDGLTNLNVRALAIRSDAGVYAATAAGAFRLDTVSSPSVLNKPARRGGNAR